MADTPVADNNKAVEFRGRPVEREMGSWNNDGISNSDGGAHNPPGVTDAAPMKEPARKPKLSKRTRKAAKGAMKRGMISQKAAKKHLGGV